MDQLNEIDSFVKQIKGNTRFLNKVVFGRPAALTAAVIFGFFLIAALATK
ncbi:hypothetical protein KQH54_00315 [bacterium]|nr:hypothetical protein [bacterium]